MQQTLHPETVSVPRQRFPIGNSRSTIPSQRQPPDDFLPTTPIQNQPKCRLFGNGHTRQAERNPLSSPRNPCRRNRLFKPASVFPSGARLEPVFTPPYPINILARPLKHSESKRRRIEGSRPQPAGKTARRIDLNKNSVYLLNEPKFTF